LCVSEGRCVSNKHCTLKPQCPVLAQSRLRDIRGEENILSANKIGFALWNFIGDFGTLDSGRTDVAYEDWHGHKLDKQLLDLIRK
jgi:hypothetical protein